MVKIHVLSNLCIYVNRLGLLPSEGAHIMRMPTASHQSRVRFPGLLNDYSGSLPALLIAVALVGGACGAGNAKSQDEFPVPDSPAAPPAKIVIPPEGEPGESLVISGTIYQPDGRTPAAGVTLSLFRTDAKGIYSPDQEEGKSPKPRLQGWVRTKADGRYEFRTIRPTAYPGGDTPARAAGPQPDAPPSRPHSSRHLRLDPDRPGVVIVALRPLGVQLEPHHARDVHSQVLPVPGPEDTRSAEFPAVAEDDEDGRPLGVGAVAEAHGASERLPLPVQTEGVQ